MTAELLGIVLVVIFFAWGVVDGMCHDVTH